MLPGSWPDVHGPSCIGQHVSPTPAVEPSGTGLQQAAVGAAIIDDTDNHPGCENTVTYRAQSGV